MSKTVFILGAGASVQAGAPLMGNFLDEAQKIWKSGKVETDDEHFETIFQQIGRLQRVNAKSTLDLNNIETVFSIFEMAELLQLLPGVEDGDVGTHIESCLKSLKRLIVRTLEVTIRFRISNERIRSAKPYDHFSYLLLLLQNNALPKHSISILTFNYDVTLDHALFVYRIPFTYILDDITKCNAIPLLKLHGSLNWGKCESCNKIVPVIIDNELLEKVLPLSDINPITTTLEVGSYLSQVRHGCGQYLIDEPMLVPPLWNKTRYHTELSSVWQKAAQVLSEAENIFVIGYSLPESDAFFRYLYGMGTVGDFPLKRFWVFDPDTKDAVKGRFEALLGSGAYARFKYCRKKFDEAIPILVEEFLDKDAARDVLNELKKS